MNFPPVGGIDPGLTGGLCIVTISGLVSFSKMPLIVCDGKKNEIDIIAIKEFFHNVEHIGLEYASSMPAKKDKFGKPIAQGTASMFNYGRGYGEIIGWLKTSGKKMTRVHPRVWKKFYNISKDKKVSKALAQRLSGNSFIFPRCSTAHEGICESFLIGRYLAEKIAREKSEI